MSNSVLTDTQSVVSATCNEPEGDVLRHVYPMVLTPRNLQRFWSLSKEHSTLFTVEIRKDFKKFLELFLRDGRDGVVPNGLFWQLDNMVGVYYMTDIQPGIDCSVHYSFFDGRHHGRQMISKMLLMYAFSEFGFQRMTAYIPLYAYPALLFVEKLGFIKEGRKRRAALYKNKWFDVNCYGILREDILKNL